MISNYFFKVSGLAAVAASATYAYTVHTAVRQTDPQRMTRYQGVPESLRNSKSVQEIIDPRNGSIVFDTRSIDVPIPAHRRDISDQELLARFTKGFFCGAVLRPERTVLRNLRWELVHLSAMNSHNASAIWSAEQIPTSSLLPVSTKMFGGFQVIDSGELPTIDSSKGHESYIDVGFGVDGSSFAGVHRFSVSRPQSNDDHTQDNVVIQYSCQVASHPWPNTVSSLLQLIGGMHRYYADLLFREGVGEVERWLQSHDS